MKSKTPYQIEKIDDKFLLGGKATAEFMVFKINELIDAHNATLKDQGECDCKSFKAYGHHSLRCSVHEDQGECATCNPLLQVSVKAQERCSKSTPLERVKKAVKKEKSSTETMGEFDTLYNEGYLDALDTVLDIINSELSQEQRKDQP